MRMELLGVFTISKVSPSDSVTSSVGKGVWCIPLSDYFLDRLPLRCTTLLKSFISDSPFLLAMTAFEKEVRLVAE